MLLFRYPYTNHTRGTCHGTVQITDAPPPGFITATGQSHSIAGGYHDAGDYDRRQSHTLVPMGLLALIAAYPNGFKDKQYNLPESGNGIPDLLDEAMWGVRIFEELQEADGGVRAGTEASRHPHFGQENAHNDSLQYRTYRRDYPTTASSAGMFAIASRLMAAHDTARSAQLLARARAAWGWMEAYAGSDKRPAQRMYAACELYEATGNDTYHAALKISAAAVLARPGWPQEYRPWHININNLVGGMFNTPYFFTYLTTSRPVDMALRGKLRALLQATADLVVKSVEATGYPHGPASAVAWGSLTSQGRYAEPVLFLHRLAPSQRLINVVSRLSDYTLGVNPLGRSYITGMGARPPTDPLHLDGYFTNERGIGYTPGITIYGPSAAPSARNPASYAWKAHYPGYFSLPNQRRECEHTQARVSGPRSPAMHMNSHACGAGVVMG